MKKSYMLIAIVGVGLLTGCGAQSTTESATTELVPSTEITETTAEEETAELLSEATEKEEVNSDDITIVEATEDNEAEQQETKENEPVTEKETAEGYYAVATGKSAEAVEEFALKVQRAVVDKDWETLASYLSDSCNMDGKEIGGGAGLLAYDIDGNLNPSFVEAIEAETCKEMFCNSMGIMMGQGEIWIGDVQKEDGTFELQVIGINGLLQS